MPARDYLTDQPRDPARPWAPSPFGRLARAHAFSVAGDAMFTTALAGLVFFSVTRLDQARWQVAAALLFTILPFSLAAPFIGPLIDRARGGRKWMIVALCGLRGLACLGLVWYRQNQLALYPLFTLLLVFAQGYILARGALVPTTVHSDAELVKANSKLAAISGVSAIVGGAVSLAVMWVPSQLDLTVGPSISLFIAAVVYAVAAYEASQLPPVRVAAAPPDDAETEELHAPRILASAAALSVVRVVVGFTTFLLAFHFKDLESTDEWASKVGLVGCIVLAQIGFLVGSAAAIRVRRALAEEQIIVAALVTIGGAGILTSVMGEPAGAMVLAFAVGLASNSAKQSFDALVQRDAPDANRGRAFARFETRFQLFWVAGALVPVAVTIPTALGSLLVGVAGAGGAAWLTVKHRRLAHAARRPLRSDEPTLVEPRPISRAFLRRRPPAVPAPVDMALVDPEDPTIEESLPDLPVTTPVTRSGSTTAEDTVIGVPGPDHRFRAGPTGGPTGERTDVWPVPPPAPPNGAATSVLWDHEDDDLGGDHDVTLADEAPWWPRPGADGMPDRPAPSPGYAGRRDAPPVPLADDELGAPSEAAWFHRPPAGSGDSHPAGAGADEAWAPFPPRPRRYWDEGPGDPDDRR